MNKIVQFPPVSCVLNEGSATHECNQMRASLLRGEFGSVVVWKITK